VVTILRTTILFTTVSRPDSQLRYIAHGRDIGGQRVAWQSVANYEFEYRRQKFAAQRRKFCGASTPIDKPGQKNATLEAIAPRHIQSPAS
jgi:hypothetical protein